MAGRTPAKTNGKLDDVEEPITETSRQPSPPPHITHAERGLRVITRAFLLRIELTDRLTDAIFLFLSAKGREILVYSSILTCSLEL